jgi:hypothetical protein
VECNYELGNALRAGENAIAQYLVENADKYSATKEIRLLETMGEINPSKTENKHIHSVSIVTGKWAKWAR